MEGLISKMKGIRKDPNRVLFPKSGNSLPSSLGSHSASGGIAASPLLNKRFTLPFLAVLAALAVGLLFLLPGGLLQAQQNNMTMVSHAENDEGAVATFTATDPEGITPITWSLLASDASDPTGVDADVDSADAEHFTIDKDGMLKFMSPPDYEASDGGGGDADMDNTYHVVVVASDQMTGGMTGGMMGYHKVTVKVTNVAETGKVTWGVDHDANNAADTPTLMQFQVGAILTASVTDGDIKGTDKTVAAARGDVEADPTWRWYRSSSKTSTGTMIDGAGSGTYTVTTADVGMYLRAVAYYVVTGNVDQETASLTSGYPVLGVRSGDNRLKFAPAAVSREVREGKKGMKVSAPVTATGNHGMVNYTLAATGVDELYFEIDQKTGQITTMVDLNFDETDTDAADQCTARNSCVVSVKATDASGSATGTAATNVFVDATVTIKITDVNEKPEFTGGPTAITVPENSMVLFGASVHNHADAAAVTYAATDQEGRNLTYHLRGDDASKFDLSNMQVLSFKDEPDYEMPTDRNKDNVYEVTVRASDGRMYADRMVKVTVSGMDEGPMIMGKDSVNFAENGKDAVATFTATDPEGATSITWSLATTAQVSADTDLEDADNADAGDFTIDSEDGMLKFTSPPDFENLSGEGVASNTYKVVVVACDVALVSNACPASPVGQAGYHKVTVMVTNVAEKGKVAWTVDADGGGTHTAGTPKLMQFQVGASLMASVSDGDIAGGTKTPTINLTWRWFRGSAPINGAETDTYNVTTADVGSRIKVVATYRVGDSTSQETASLTSDYPVLAVRAGDNKLKFDPAMVSREVAESKKGMKVGAPVTATGNHGAVNYTLAGTGADENYFEIDQKTGQITTMVDLDFDETDPEQADQCTARNSCVVSVKATDATGTAATNVFVDATVTIKITDVNEKPMFVTDGTGTPAAASPQTIMRDENMTALLDGTDSNATYAATDPEGLNVNLTLMGPDGAKFQLSFVGVLSFKMKPDYEMPADANKDNVYMVTVRASDGTLYEDRMVMVTVTDVDEAPVIMYGGLGISGPTSVSYAEDRRDAVATYTASGPNAASARWSLEGVDDGDFRISSGGGVLTFKTSPDFDNPADANTDNVYMVMVKARDSGGNMAERQVTVTVTGMDDTTPTPGGSVLAEYDADDSGRIERSEVLTAIGDLVFQRTNIQRDDVLSIIGAFVFQRPVDGT